MDCPEVIDAALMGRRPKANGAKGKQTSLLAGGFDFVKYPQLKKPMEVIGETIKVPGKFWDKCPAADTEKMYKCVNVDYSIAHKFAVGPMQPAFKMQEMGESGTGSLEQGDSSGEVFWMHSPDPFLHRTAYNLCVAYARTG